MQIWAQEVEVGIGIAICTSGLVAWGIRESVVSFAPKGKIRTSRIQILQSGFMMRATIGKAQHKKLLGFGLCGLIGVLGGLQCAFCFSNLPN